MTKWKWRTHRHTQADRERKGNNENWKKWNNIFTKLIMKYVTNFFPFFLCKWKIPFFSFIAQFFTLYLSFIYTTTIRLFAMGSNCLKDSEWAVRGLVRPLADWLPLSCWWDEWCFLFGETFYGKLIFFLYPNCCLNSSSRFFASAVVNLMRRLVDGSGLRREIAAGSEAYSDQISSGGAGGRLINTFWFNSNFYPEKI